MLLLYQLVRAEWKIAMVDSHGRSSLLSAHPEVRENEKNTFPSGERPQNPEQGYAPSWKAQFKYLPIILS